MKHHKSIRKFGRKRNQRIALMRSLALSLIDHEKIKTTEAKAKELRPFIEKLVTIGRKNTLAARRIVVSRLGETGGDGARKLVDNIAPRYKGRPGGYTRIIKLENRKGDGSPMAIIEFIQGE